MVSSDTIEPAVPTLQEIVDRFVVQFELAAAARHRERADRAFAGFKESLEHFFFDPPVFDDDEPIGYVLPERCLKAMNSSGFITAGDVRGVSLQYMYEELTDAGRKRVAEILTVLARFGVAPGRDLS